MVPAAAPTLRNSAGNAAEPVPRTLDGVNMKQPRPVFIGLVGPSGSGKTSICQYLEENHGFITMHVAMPLKWAFCRMFGAPISDTERPAIDEPKDYLGGVTPRAVLEHLGTRLHEIAPMALPLSLDKRLRRALRVGASHVLIDGVRRDTEAEVIRRHTGATWRVGRVAVDPSKPCDLSQAEIECDHEIPNFDTYPELYAHLDATLAA